MKNKAFTLSEVLITLGIIGVVAAMTMPILIKNYQKKLTVSKLKKAYSVLSQAIKMSIIENGNFEHWDYDNYPNSGDYVEKFYKPYLKTIKTCNTPNECNYLNYYYGSKCSNGSRCPIWACVNGNNQVTCNYNWFPNGTTVLVLPDNTNIIFETIDSYGNAITTPERVIYVDINGYKGPNIYGKDLFLFTINEKGLFTTGYNLSENEIKSNCSLDGLKTRCTTKIARDGWEIKDDYPW